MFVMNLGCSPHFEQRGEVGFWRSCFSMPHIMPRTTLQLRKRANKACPPRSILICASQCSPKVMHSFLVSKIKCSVRVGGIARCQHRVPAIERDLVEQ
jgi:hypothetical protein